MARCTYAPIVGDIRGRVAGSVFSLWRGIAYVKKFSKPGNPNTSAQQAIRAAFAFLTVQWKLLQSELVAAWQLYSEGKSFTGRNAFIGQGVVEQEATELYPLTPHNPSEFPVVLGANTPAANQVTLNWTYPDSLTSNRARIYYQRQGVNQLVFFSEELNTATSKIVDGLTSLVAYNFWIVKKNNDSSELAQDVRVAASPL